MKLADVIKKFNTTPFLFVGSGMTRRYFGLPNWRELLEHFAHEVRGDEYAYSAYESKAKAQSPDTYANIMPAIAGLIQRDYDERWFSGAVSRNADADAAEQIRRNGLSPFKAEVAAYIRHKSVIDERYRAEIDKLSAVSARSITGIITTNYDTFLENRLEGFKTYVGQEELIFSPLQGVAEIYKIHGSVDTPDSIIISDSDYRQFESGSAYLAAKLMTIFMEYPVVFMGYSITDPNIRLILQAIVGCLSPRQIAQLENRFVFVEYQQDMTRAAVSSDTFIFGGKALPMTKITLSDFLPLYEAIGQKRAKLPVRVLRRCKEELYTFVVTNQNTPTLRVASIDDGRVADDDLAMAIGRLSTFGIRGLNGITGNEWYRDIVLNDLMDSGISADELLEYAYPRLIKQNGRLPLNKYLSLASRDFSECRKFADHLTLDAVIPESERNLRGTLAYHSATEIWKKEKEKAPFSRVIALISRLYENELSVTDFEAILKDIFTDTEAFDKTSKTNRSLIRRLILIYDILKWGK